MISNLKQTTGAMTIALLLIYIGSSSGAQGATSQSKQVSILQKQVNKLKTQIEELEVELDLYSTSTGEIQRRISSLESNASAISKFQSYSESQITYLNFNDIRNGARCPSGTFSDFIGIGGVQIPYRSYSDSEGIYRNSFDVIKCTLTVLTKKS